MRPFLLKKSGEVRIQPASLGTLRAYRTSQKSDSESVMELLEEGQSFEAEVIGGVEDAADPDVAEVHTRQFPEDDVPSEYLGKDD